MIQIPVIFLGLGNVGQALLRQVLDTRDALAQRAGLRLALTGLADSQATLLDPAGLPDDDLEQALQAKSAGRSLGTLPGNRPLDALTSALGPGAILADLTASPDTAPILLEALEAECGLVLANKHLLGGPWAGARALLAYAHLRYEVTVGAGLPVISTLRTLLDTGDQVTAIEGCLSGTLGYLCAQLERGTVYSEAVSQAKDLGYTEPDPREDLSGRDVARKALILARTAGWPLEMGDLSVEPLYTETLSDVSVQEFMAAMPILNGPYARRVQNARVKGQVLRYTACIGPKGGQVGLEAVPQDSLLGALHGPANYLALHTTRYAAEPLVLSGPGAGPEVTAAGVLGDIVNLADKFRSHDFSR
jgi:homoserine dehydrogenase